jgi:hypothetical protein
MGGLIEPSPLTEKERDSNLRPILFGVVLVVLVVGVIALLTRGSPKKRDYAASLRCEPQTFRSENERGGELRGGQRHLH